jgi:hypothetical protein
MEARENGMLHASARVREIYVHYVPKVQLSIVGYAEPGDATLFEANTCVFFGILKCLEVHLGLLGGPTTHQPNSE